MVTVSEVFASLPGDLQLVLQRMKYTPPDTTLNFYDEYVARYARIPPEESAVAACGIFLQGRAKTIKGLSEELARVRFPIGRVIDIVREHKFNSIEQCIVLFQRLFEGGLVGFFFRSIAHFPHFRRDCWQTDAFMHVDGFCEEVAKYIDYHPIDGLGRAPVVPFYTLQFPHIELTHAITDFCRTITADWIVESNPRSRPGNLNIDFVRMSVRPFTRICAAVCNLIAWKDFRHAEGDYSTIWKLITSAKERLSDDLKAIVDQGERDAKKSNATLHTIIRFIVARSLPFLLIAILLGDKKRVDSKVDQYVLTCSEIVKLHPYFHQGCITDDSLFEEAKPVIQYLFRMPDV
jgi:hypothetical protein